MTGGPPPGGVQPVMSAMTNFANSIDSGAARMDDSAIALFTFSEGAGDVTVDSSGVGRRSRCRSKAWSGSTAEVCGTSIGKAQASAADSRKLFEMITPANAYYGRGVAHRGQQCAGRTGARCQLLARHRSRNFTLGQNAIYYQLRNRSAATGANGTPELEALDPQVDTALQHIVMTFDGVTGRKIYINGQLSIEENVANDTLAWTDDNLLVLGNEVTNDRLWQGVIKLVAIHNKALNGAEVQQNFDAGTGNIVTMRFDISSIVGQTAYIDMQAAQIDRGRLPVRSPDLRQRRHRHRDQESAYRRQRRGSGCCPAIPAHRHDGDADRNRAVAAGRHCAGAALDWTTTSSTWSSSCWATRWVSPKLVPASSPPGPSPT